MEENKNLQSQIQVNENLAKQKETEIQIMSNKIKETESKVSQLEEQLDQELANHVEEQS